jgi:hypothetical protein
MKPIPYMCEDVIKQHLFAMIGPADRGLALVSKPLLQVSALRVPDAYAPSTGIACLCAGPPDLERMSATDQAAWDKPWDVRSRNAADANDTVGPQ